MDRLAEYLVKLREQTSLCLSNHQASRIITLWESLDDGDKQRVIYAARHQARLLSGRFRTHKTPSNTPGVDSTTRCVLGASSAPAQWPDCCRLVESIFKRLCSLHPSPRRKGKRADTRWSLILRDYRRIRQLVLGNGLIMQGTEMQLVEVNQTTLIQWHNNRQKQVELSVCSTNSHRWCHPENIHIFRLSHDLTSVANDLCPLPGCDVLQPTPVAPGTHFN